MLLCCNPPRWAHYQHCAVEQGLTLMLAAVPQRIVHCEFVYRTSK